MLQAIRIAKVYEEDVHSNLQDLAKALDMSADDTQTMSTMFCTKGAYVPVFNNEFQCEFAFNFWWFVKNDNARELLLRVWFCCMKPRIYMVSETLAGHHVEVLMIVKLDRLCMAREQFEQWLEFS